MLSWIREKFGSVIIGSIIAFIAFVFVFYGVFSPKATRGLHEGAVAGTINGDPVSISEFNREVNHRLEMLKGMGAGKLSDEQLKSLRVREMVFQELANRKLMLQEAKRQGLIASDEEVRQKITEMPVFQKDGKFDLATYKQVLDANNYTPAGFERLVRDDVSLQQWEGYFESRIHASDSELKKEYVLGQDKRNIKYVVLTPEAAKTAVTVKDEDLKKFLADPSKLNLVQMKFKEGAEGLYKGMKFDQAKESIARGILAGDQFNELQKINEKLAADLLAQMTEEPASDARVNNLLKPYKIQVKTTGLVSHQSTYLPGLGEVKELLTDAFSPKSPIDPKLGGKPKKYTLPGRTVVAMVVQSQAPDFAQFDQQRESLIREVTARKVRGLYEDWMKNLNRRARVDTNPSVVSP